MNNLTEAEKAFLILLKDIKCISTRLMNCEYIQVAEGLVSKKLIVKQSSATSSIYHYPSYDFNNLDISSTYK